MTPEILKPYLSRLNQIGRAMSEEELDSKCIIYTQALEDVPEAYLEEITKEALKQCHYFPAPKKLVEIWEKVEFKIPKEKKKEDERPNTLTEKERQILERMRVNDPKQYQFWIDNGIESDPNGYLEADLHEKVVQSIVRKLCHK